MITRDQALVLLEPKLSNIWHDAYPIVPVEYTSFVNTRTTKKATITDFKLSDFGALRLKGEGENVIYDEPLFGQTNAYLPVRFALGYKVTQEMIDHELYGQVEKFEKALMKSAVDLQEVTAALLWNNAFSTTNASGYLSTGFDGLALCSTAHPRLDGGTTLRNRPTTDATLSLTGLQSALIDIDRLRDDRGRPIFVRPKLLIVNPEDRFTAKEILESEYKPGTANNEVNALKDAGLSFMVSHYLSSAKQWHVLCDQHDLSFIWDERPRGGMENDFDAEVIKRKIVEGFIVGHGEWRGTWGANP